MAAQNLNPASLSGDLECEALVTVPQQSMTTKVVVVVMLCFMLSKVVTKYGKVITHKSVLFQF